MSLITWYSRRTGSAARSSGPIHIPLTQGNVTSALKRAQVVCREEIVVRPLDELAGPGSADIVHDLAGLHVLEHCPEFLGDHAGLALPFARTEGTPLKHADDCRRGSFVGFLLRHTTLSV